MQRGSIPFRAVGPTDANWIGPRLTMRTNADDVQPRAGASLLLFVRAADDLARACREAGELLAFRHRRSGLPANRRVYGAWIHEHTITDIPQRLDLPRSAGETVMFAIRETSALWGIWAVAWIEPVCLETGTAVDLAHDMVLDALLGSARCDIGRTGRYSPAFARDTPVKQVHAQTKRLNVHYPLRIERPIYIDPVTGGLSLENE